MAEADDVAAARALRRAASDANRLVRAAARSGGGVAVVEVGGGSFLGRPGRRARVRVVGGPCASPPIVENDDPGAPALEPTVVDRGGGRFVIVWGAAAGAATLDATPCGARGAAVVNLGAPGALAMERPGALEFPQPTMLCRVGESVVPNVPTARGTNLRYSVAPPLPAGLVLDRRTGGITGVPEAAAAAGERTITARNLRGSVSAAISVSVAPALPGEVLFLEPGFVAERVLADALLPAKIARTPDGRILYSELTTGRIRVLAADGTPVEEPFATVSVAVGGERGLLGLAVSPAFEQDGHVFVFASVPASGPLPERNQVIRFTAVGDVGSDPVVIVDGLPVANGQNAGALAFGPDGRLFVSVGDTGDETLAQTDGSRAGRVLRYAADGSVPADNPIPGDPEWCRGFRNPYDLTFHPVTGGLFVSENGPTAHDEIDFAQPGRNFEWGALPESVPASRVGRRIVDWTPVIVPTGIAFHTGVGFGAEYEDDLFVCGYDAADVRRLALSGPSRVDLDEERPFLRFSDVGVDHRPLDCLVAPDGSLWISTFTAIWRVRRW